MGRWIPPGKNPGQASPPVPQKIEKLSVQDRENIKREVEETKAILENKDQGDIVGVSKSLDPVALASMKKSVIKKERMLQRDEELIARGPQKDKIYQEIKEIEAEVVPHMPTQNEMWSKYGTQDMDLAVRKNMHFQKTYGPKLERLKNLKMMLEHENPIAGNLDLIRRPR